METKIWIKMVGIALVVTVAMCGLQYLVAKSLHLSPL